MTRASSLLLAFVAAVVLALAVTVYQAVDAYLSGLAL